MPVRECITRSRLLTCLNLGLESRHRLILISAPAGFGKSTLVSDWLHGLNLPAAWISLDEDDNELVRFLTYFITALQQYDPAFGEDVLSILRSPQFPPVEIILTELLNQITSLARKIMIVLDDYHLITEKSIHKAIYFFLENLPPETLLVIISRADPPIPLARYRARNQMTELRVADLRFTFDEITPFLNISMQLNLSADQIQSLDTRTEGWIAGLQMAALSLKGKDDIDRFIADFSGSHRFILDYLTDEVLRGQSKEIQDFILQTSILDRLCGPLCDAVTGLSSSQEILEKLDENNVFLSPLDDDRVWYRYHHLFADVMTNRLNRRSSSLIPELHFKAAKWFLKNHLYADAIDQAIASGDLQFAAKILDGQALNLLKIGKATELLGWAKKIPDEIIDQQHRLRLFVIWAWMLTGKTENVEQYIALIEQGAKKRGDYDELRGDIAAVQAYEASRKGELEKALQYAHAALKWLGESNFTVRSVMYFVLGGIYYSRKELEKSADAMQKAGDLGERSGNVDAAVSALSALGSIRVVQRDFEGAENAYQRAFDLSIGKGGKILPIASSIYSGFGRYYLAKNDLEKARESATKGLEMAEKWMNADSQVGSLLTLVQVNSIEGNQADAIKYLGQAKKISSTYQLMPGMAEQIQACETQIGNSSTNKIDQSTLPEPLTERELEVLQLLAAGMSNRAIAAELVIALGTTKTHISRIMGKLNAENRTRAVILARELGLITE